MIDKICTCNHIETDHKLRSKAPAEILDSLRKSRYVEVQHHPDQMEPVGYFVKNENKMYSPEEMYNSITIIRDNFSPCGKMFCKCQKFQADNLKTLENAYERKASQIIH